MSIQMSVVDNRTVELWRGFGPFVKHIDKLVSANKYSLQIYPTDYFQAFNPAKCFTKWACVEVESTEAQAEELAMLHLEGGLYAVFVFRGFEDVEGFFKSIYTDWLPNSGYQLADRPHFEVLGPKYKPNDTSSEEEVWIPIKA